MCIEESSSLSLSSETKTCCVEGINLCIVVGIRNEVTTEIKRLDKKIDIAIQIRERLASLEAKVAAMSR